MRPNKIFLSLTHTDTKTLLFLHTFLLVININYLKLSIFFYIREEDINQSLHKGSLNIQDEEFNEFTELKKVETAESDATSGSWAVGAVNVPSKNGAKGNHQDLTKHFSEKCGLSDGKKTVISVPSMCQLWGERKMSLILCVSHLFYCV